MKHDVVYFVKESSANEELRYSLRSICENFSFRKAWFYGGRPSYLQPDGWVHVVQNQRTKWMRTTAMIRQICENKDITEDWWLFNDDFFVLRKTEGIEAPYYRDIYRHIVRIEDRHLQRATAYTQELRRLAATLERRGCTVRNYALHMPILINKEKALATLDAFQDCPMFRSLYGNYNDIGGTEIQDCKIAGLDRLPEADAIFMSTDDNSFAYGRAGAFIREKFREPCKYEL